MVSAFRPIVVIPCCNHGSTVERVLDGLIPLGLPVIIVDDGSEKITRETLVEIKRRRKEVTLIRHETNLGKGAAVFSALKLAEKQGFTHALQVDADGQHNLEDAHSLLTHAKAEPEALWSAKPIFDKSIPKKRLIGRYITHFWVWIETLSLDIEDSLCGYRVYPIPRTLQIIHKHGVGMFMDFDPEIMVRFFWTGAEVRFIPSKVIYPEGGYSNFHLWADNVRISKMHMRLCIESPLWWPNRINRFLKTSPKKRNHWSNIPERRSASGMKVLWQLYRLGGYKLFQIVALPVTAIFYLSGKQARHASRHFLDRVEAQREKLGLPSTQLSSFQHFRSFTNSVIDRLAAWSGDLKFNQDVVFLDDESKEVLTTKSTTGRGKLILVSHIGIPDALRALGQHELSQRITTLVFQKHSPGYTALLNEISPDCSRDLISVDDIGVETAAYLVDVIARGEWVAIAADRTPNDQSSRGSRTATASFLGHDAPFPVGPFVLANLLKCDVVTLFAVRVGDKLLISCRPFASQIQLPRKTRDEALAQYASQWAKTLEDQAVAHPYQWFNFYDFWHEDEKQ